MNWSASNDRPPRLGAPDRLLWHGLPTPRLRPVLPARYHRQNACAGPMARTPVWAGLTQDGSVLELWVGDDTWTIIETVPTTPERMSCHRSAGTGSSGAPVVGSPASEEP